LYFVRSDAMAIPSITEDTVTDWLREELEKRGIKLASTQIKFDKPGGSFVKPDIYIQNGVDYVVQAKLGDEAKTFDAVGQVWDSIKYGGVQGGFVVVYPHQLRRMSPARAREMSYRLKSEVYAYFGPRDKRPPLHKRGSLEKIARWIAAQVLQPPEYIEPDISFVIKQLRKTADYITGSLKHLTEKDLEDLFGGRSVFENILQYEEGKYPLKEMQRATAHLLINQILFYHILCREDPQKYKEIDEDFLKRPNGLLTYFNRVLDVDYSAMFGYDVVSRIPLNALNPLKLIIKNVKALTPEKIRHDLLGQMFHTLIPLDIRKSVAAYYTNVEAAELLAHLTIDSHDVKVADLAVGSGGLLVASYRRKRSLLEEKFTFRDHKRFIEEEITGIDIMPFAAHLAVINLSLQAPLYETEKVRIGVWDSTTLRPGTVIPSMAKVLKEAYKAPKLDAYLDGEKPKPPSKAYIEAGAVTAEKIGGEKIPLGSVSVVIMNPPFTRQERLPPAYKRHLDERFARYRQYSHGQLGLHGFFIFLSDSFLCPNGRLALVLPATVLRVRSMEGVRRFLSKRYKIEYIITAWKKLAFSEAAWVREILLVARKLSAKEKSAGFCNVVTLRRLPKSLIEAQNLAQEIQTNRIIDATKTYESENLFIMSISQQELSQNIHNWFSYIAVYNPKIRNAWKNIVAIGDTKLTSFGKYSERKHLRVNRGVETRSREDVPVQSMMIGSSEERLPRKTYAWVLDKVGRRSITVKNRYTGNKITIPASAYVRGLVTYSGIPTMNLAENTDYIVVSRFSKIDRFLEPQLRRRVIHRLRQWRAYVNQRLGNILICRRYVPTAPGFCHTCFYTKEPIAPPGMMWSIGGITPEDAKIIALWMNSTFHLCQILLKKIQDVWIDVHEYVLNTLLILDPQAISDKDKEYLLSIFDEVCGIRFPSLEQQIETRFEARSKIDLALLQVLGFNGKEAKKFVAMLYDAILQEFRVLKELGVSKR
jgi:type I restriction-modification system DNA methylase subunit